MHLPLKSWVRGTNLAPPTQTTGAHFPWFLKTGRARGLRKCQAGGLRHPAHLFQETPLFLLLSLTLRSFPPRTPPLLTSQELSKDPWASPSVTSLVLQAGNPMGSLGGQPRGRAPGSEHPGWMGPRPPKRSCFTPHFPQVSTEKSPSQRGPPWSLYLK